MIAALTTLMWSVAVLEPASPDAVARPAVPDTARVEIGVGQLPAEPQRGNQTRHHQIRSHDPEHPRSVPVNAEQAGRDCRQGRFVLLGMQQAIYLRTVVYIHS